MKKFIITGIVLITVLMGCSFAKPPSAPEVKTTSNEPLDIFTAVKTEDLVFLEKDLASRASQELNKLDSNGNTLFDVALERGSLEVISLLLKRGVSPYKPNSHGISFYNNIKNSPQFENNTSFMKLSSEMPGIASSLKILGTDDWSGLSSLVNNFSAPCDQIISYMSANSNDRKISLSKFISATPSCRFSLENRAMTVALQNELKRAIKSSFSNLFDVVALTNLLPKSLRYVSIRDASMGTYFIHPQIIVKTLRALNPVQADEISNQLSADITNDDPTILYSWKSAGKQIEKKQKTISTLGQPADPSIFKYIETRINEHFSSAIQFAEENK